MTYRRPLGEYKGLSGWSSKPKPWGPDGRWKAWFGGGVVNGVCELLDEHLDSRQSSRLSPAVLGISPWITHPGVVDRLIRMSGVCIVADKATARQSAETNRLIAKGTAFPNVLPALWDRSPLDDGGTPAVIGPYSNMPDYDVGPVRVVGWSSASKATPMPHAKVLLLGWLGWGEDDFGVERHFFVAGSVWWGSANLTLASANHLETGHWCDDRDLVQTYAEFIGDVIAFSEPHDTKYPSPEPNLVPVEWDDEGFGDYLGEYSDPDD